MNYNKMTKAQLIEKIEELEKEKVSNKCDLSFIGDALNSLLTMGLSREEAIHFIDVMIATASGMNKPERPVFYKPLEKKPEPAFKPRDAKIEELVGKTLYSVDVVRNVEGEDDKIIFNCMDGTAYKMYHEQDCCESVTIEDICGELDRLVGKPITKAEELVNSNGDRDYDESSTWTFYNLATVRGYVTIRWYGESNGYYSESVNFMQIR